MDSGWIVAGTSIATIVATGFFSLRAKRIEAELKLNEHKMSIRSAYFMKKIEAGQLFVNKNTVQINHINALYRYFIDFKKGKALGGGLI